MNYPFVKNSMVLLLVLMSSSVFAQYYDMPGGTVEICKGFFRDSGGDSSYSNDEVIETTFCSVSEDLQISMLFEFIDIETNYDYLYVYDGPDSTYPLITTFNGSYTDIAVCATGQCLTFKFISDYSITPAGWFGTITCGYCEPVYVMEEGIQTTCVGNFLDPGANGNYANNTNITTTFCSDNQEEITAFFNSVDLETNYDYLYIYEGLTTEDELLAVLNGTLENVEVCSTTGCLTFNFITDGSVLASGWDATISCGACTQYFDMPTEITQTCSGFFRDAGGAGNYSNNEDLVTTICASDDAGSVIISFEFIEVELNYDYLYVHDGPSTDSPIIAIYNGSYQNEEICSSGSCLTFNFKSDNTVLQAGWKGSIQCGDCDFLPEEFYSMQSGRINTCDALFLDPGGHNDYDNNQLHVQTICTSNQPSPISVDFLWIEIEPNYDYLAVFDGPSNTGEMLAQFSGSFQNQTFCSNSGCLTFQFTSDISITPAGWLAFVSCDETCDDVITTIQSEKIISDEILLYPNPVEDRLFIELKSFSEVNLTIINSNGQEIISKRINSSVESIDVSNLTTGLYIIRLYNRQHFYHQKFIKR